MPWQKGFSLGSKPNELDEISIKTRTIACADLFYYIEIFYNVKRHHGNNNGLSPIEYGKRYFEKIESF